MKRLLFSVILFSIGANGSPVFPPPAFIPLFQPQAGIVTLDLGGGLIWQGSQLNSEEWDQRMALLPADALLIHLEYFPLELSLGSLRAELEPPTATPEPSSLTLIGLGLLAGMTLLRGRALRS